MEAQSNSRNVQKSNTLTVEPKYNAIRLKTDLAYRFEQIDAFTTHLNSISDYANRVRYYLDTTLAMGFPIPEFHTGLSVNVFEDKKQLITEETEDGWEPQSVGDRCPIRKPRNLAPIASTKEWKLSPQNSRERGILCKLWFEKVRFTRFPRLIFDKQDEYREWINETKDERIANFNRNSAGWNRAVYTKTESEDVKKDMMQFLDDFAIVQAERDQVNTQMHGLTIITNRKAREQQRYKAESEHNQPFDLIRRELSGKNGGINWSAFTQGRQLECFGILWGMVEYWQWLEAGAVEVVSIQNNETIDTQESRASDQEIVLFNRMPLEDTIKHFMQLAKERGQGHKTFLTESQVDQFIDKAFRGNVSVPKQTFSSATRNKGKIIGCFKKYYDKCVDHNRGIGQYDPDASVVKYIHLLVDNFDNWSYEQIENNFRENGEW